MKKIIAMMLVTLLLVTSSGVDVSARNIKRDREWASQVYYEYECKNRGRYMEIDLNGDTVKECISLNPQRGVVYIYACKDCRAKVLLARKGFGDYGYVGYNAKKHLVVFKGDLGRYRMGMYVYKVGKNKCVETEYMWKTTYGKPSYWINGKKVSKKKYNKKIKYYTNITKSMKKYGYKVPKSQYM